MARIDELRLMTRVARMYYQQDMRQSGIADRLHLSQATVSRLLRRARREGMGIVRITVSVPMGVYAELKDALISQYGLQNAVVADCENRDDEEEILGRRLEPIHIVGGGTQNRLLNQFAADATGRRVITGPIEATAAGNVITQAMALGHIRSLEEGRRIVRNSFDVATYEPAGEAEWDEAYDRFLDTMEQIG